MSLLDHPTAQALLADAELSADDVAACRRRLEDFLQRYLPRFYRVEQHELALVVLQGKLSNLQRKTSEPIAYQAGRHRKPVQHFVGAGRWDDEAVMAELRRHVAQEGADPDAVLVLDPSGFPKSGADSCGVARQWCGRLGKIDNCQVGVFLSYVTAQGYAPLDRQLYLPRAWAFDPCGPTTHRGGLSGNASWRFRRPGATADRGDRRRVRRRFPPPSSLPDIPLQLERPPQATASGRPAEDTPCTTNSRRVNAPSVSASPADPSSTSARLWVASRPGSTSGGVATWKMGPTASTT